MTKKMRRYVFNTTSSVAAGLVAGTLGGVVGGAVLGLVLAIVTDGGLTAYSALFFALYGGAIGVPIGAITGMLKPVICQGTVTKVAWIVVSGLGSGLGARLLDVSEMDIIIVFTVLGAIIAGVTSQRLTLLFGRESGEEVTPKKMIYYNSFSPGGFSLGRTGSLCSSEAFSIVTRVSL